MRRTIWVFLLVLVVSGAAIAQEVKKVPAKYTSPAEGGEMFKAYCASCHGTDAKGGGPAAQAIKMKVPDLTQLAMKNGGNFPFEHVSQMILGESLVTAHGSKEMPVWGPTFLSMDQRSQATVKMRAKNLTQYIEGVQAK